MRYRIFFDVETDVHPESHEPDVMIEEIADVLAVYGFQVIDWSGLSQDAETIGVPLDGEYDFQDDPMDSKYYEGDGPDSWEDLDDEL